MFKFGVKIEWIESIQRQCFKFLNKYFETTTTTTKEKCNKSVSNWLAFYDVYFY